MAQLFEVHPDNPQPRFLRQAAQMLQAGGLGAIPTDSSYAFVCRLDDKAAAEALLPHRQGCDALLVARPLASLEHAGAEQGGVPTVCSVALSGDERCVVSGASDGSLQMFVLDGCSCSCACGHFSSGPRSRRVLPRVTYDDQV